MKKDSIRIGPNRTGIATSPADARELIEVASHTAPSALGGGELLLATSVELAEPMGGLGSMPPPATMKGLGAAALELMKGQRAPVLLDKMGERLAFERTGARLYQKLLAKLDAEGSWGGGPTHDELVEILNDELRHFSLLEEALTELGADPTAMTPSADVSAVVSQGVVAIVHDARTGVRESLEAILVAELVDHASWELLEALTRAMGHPTLAERFVAAKREESTHLLRVETWLRAGLGVAAHAELQPSASP